MNIFLLQVAQPTQAAPQGAPAWTLLVFFVVIILIFRLFSIRPQSKRQKKLQQQRDALAVGDSIITAGGVYGVIHKVYEQTFEVEITKNVCIEISKSSVYPLGADPNARQQTPQPAKTRAVRLNLTPKLRLGGKPVVRKQRIPGLKRLLAIAVWALLATALRFTQTFSCSATSVVHIPIVYEEMPKAIGLEDEQPTMLDVSVSVKGSQLLFRWMEGVAPIKLSMPQRVPLGGRVLFSNVALTQKVYESLGSAVQIREIYPNQISLRTFPLQRKEVPVINRASTSAKDGYVVLPLTTTPTTVELYSNREALEGINEIRTKGLLYKNLSQDEVMRVPLKEVLDAHSFPDSVQLQISVVEFMKGRIELPVMALNTPAGLVTKLLPAHVSLTLTMPITDYNKPVSNQVSMVVDLSQILEAAQNGERRPEMLPVRIEGLPDWVVRATAASKTVQYILEAAEP